MSETITLKMLGKYSKICGVGHPEPENYSAWSWCKRAVWTAYSYVVNVILVTECLGLIMRVIVIPNDLGIFCACTAGVCYIGHFLAKLVILNKYQSLYRGLVNEIVSLSTEFYNDSFRDDYIRLHDKWLWIVIKTSVIRMSLQFIGNIILIGGFMLMGVMNGPPEDGMPVSKVWTPYENTTRVEYFFTTLMELIAFCCTAVRNGHIDLLVWLMLVIPALQLSYLRRILPLIIDGRILKDGSPEEIQSVNENFVIWIKYHQRVVRVIEGMKTIAAPFLAANYLMTLLMLMLTGIVAISSSSWNLLQQVLITFSMICNAAQLYFVSLNGDVLEENNESASTDGFSHNVIYGGKKLWQNYLFVNARSRHSLRIRFGGINPLNSDTFGQLLRLTATYFVTIVQLRDQFREEQT